MTESEQWDAYLSFAQAQKATAGIAAAGNNIVGRSITYIVHKLCDFWGEHKATLIPFLSNLAIAALEALVAQRGAIDAVNGPGPN